MKEGRESQLIRYLGNNVIHRGKRRGHMLQNDIFKTLSEKKKKKKPATKNSMSSKTILQKM